MNRTERLHTIFRIAEEVDARYAWARADLLLNTFGAEELSADPFETRRDYLDRRLNASTDDVLAQLNEFLFPPEPYDPVVQSSTFASGSARVFISHSSLDREIAADLSHAMSSLGVVGFVAHEDIHPTTAWLARIEEELSSCSALVAICSPHFNESHWTNQEVGWAFGRSLPVVAFRLGADPVGFLGMRQAVRSWADGDTAARTVIDLLLEDERSRASVQWSIVRMFSESDSFQSARARYGELLKICSISDEMEDALRRATVENRQIADCLYRNSRLPDLVGQFIEQRRAGASVG